MDKEKMITITLKEYKSLKVDADTMRKCEAYGIDNWEGWQMWEDEE